MNNNSTICTRIGVLCLSLFFTLCAHAQAPYCLPTYDRGCSNGDGFGTAISQFNFKRGATTLIDDQTGCNQPNSYIHFLTTTPSVSGGSSYAFDIAFVTPDDGGGPPIAINAGYAIWIDLNNNNTFENTEIVASGLAAESGTITIPSGTTVGNHRMRIRSNRIVNMGFPSPALPTNPCTLQDMGDTHDYTINVISCPTITDSTSIRLNVTCVGNNNGQFQFVGKGGTAPYTFTLGTITGDVTNTTGLFTGLAARDYRLTVTDANGCSGTSIRTIESFTDFSALNNSMLNYDWRADSLPTVGTGLQYNYLTSPQAAFRINGDSLAKYNQGNTNALSNFIPIGFSFKMDNFYYDSLVISEDGIVSFNRKINPAAGSSQWYNNETYTGLNTYTSPNVGDCQCDTAYLNNPLPFIAPFRDDMTTNSSGNVNSKIQYQISGTAPNRVFTVEWRNMRWNRVCNVQRDNSVSFQVALFEGTNNVQFHYKPEENLKLDNCGGDFMGDFSTVSGYNYSAGLFGRRLGGGNYIALNPDSSRLFANAPRVTGSGASTVLYRGVKTDNQNFPSAIKYPIGKHYQLTAPTNSSCIDPLSISAVATCSSGSDGMITITATGGLPKLGTPTTDRRYFYSKDGGKTYRLGTLVNVGTTYQDTFKNLAPGTYRIAVQDNQTYQIPGNASPNFQSFIIQTIVVADTRVTPTTTSPTCNSSTSGSIALSWAASSPLGGYKVDFQKVGGALQTSNETTTTKTFTGLSAGTYGVTVSFNDLDCETSKTIVLNVPTTVNLNATSVTQPACPANATTGVKTGSFTVTASGGTSPYTFTLPSGLTAASSTATTNSFTGLSAGTYVISVSDANLCAITESVTISNPTDYAINNIVTTPPSCNGGTNGAASFNVTGGAAATFNSIAFGSSPTQTFSSIAKGTTVNAVNLAGGNYNVSVTEGSCTYNVSAAINLTEPTPLSISSTSATITTCNADADGTLTITATGGTGAYEFSKDNGMTYVAGANPYTFMGLTGGNYSTKVRDANGCVSATVVGNVPKPTVVKITLVRKVDIKCKGGATGLIEVDADGGRVPSDFYRFSIGGFPSTNPLFTGLTAGMYTITATDDFGCSATIDVTLTEPTNPLSIGSVSTTPATCATGGTVTTSASGGTSPYTFKLTSSLSNMTGSFTNVTGGSYTLIVTDANNCESTTSASVGNSAAPKILVSSQTDILCNGGTTGAFTFSVSGGTGAYTVVVKDALNATVSTTGVNPYTASSLAAGTFSISVTDGASCSASQNVILTQPTTPLSIAVNSQTNVLCNGASTGAVTLSATGGNSISYTYKKDASTSNTTGTFTGLAMGTYIFTVTDGNNCTATKSVTISESTLLVLNQSMKTDVACKGGSTGAVTLLASGGNSMSYTYKKDASTSNATGVFTGLTAGTYVFTVTDGNNCTATKSVTISEPTNPLSIGSVSTTPATCATGGTVTTSASGGTSPYTFKLTSSLSNMTGSFINVTGGSYTLTVTDANSCESTTSVSVGNSTAPTILVSSQTNILCSGGTTGAFTFSVSGGTGAYTVVVKDALNVTVSTTGANPYTASSLAAGTYSISVTDGASCSASQNVMLTQPTTPLSIAVNSQTNVLCNGASTGAVTLLATGGNSISYTYKKDASTSNTTGTFTGLAMGTYIFTVTDGNNCTATKSVTILESTLLVLNQSMKIDVACKGGATGAVTLLASGGNNSSYSYKKDASTTNATGVFTGLTAGTYVFTVTDGNNCTATKSVQITEPTAPLSISVASQQNKDCSNPTGSVALSVGGGTGSLQVSLDGTNFQNGLTFNGLAATTYTATVKDANNCTKTVGFTIADNGTLPPTPNPIANRVICGGEMTTITPSATGVTTFKFYGSDPTGGGVTPLSTGASYVYTVSATKTFWITSVSGLCESAPIQTTVTKFDCAALNDPCACKNNATTLTNGQFNETVEVTAPVGQTWTVTAVTGLYSMSSAAPPAAPTLISIGTTMTYNVGLARYLLSGIHIDDAGYSVTVSNGMGTVLTISNKCFYPNPTFALAAAFCSNDAAVTLTGSATIGGASATAAIGTGSFTIDGTAATAFNPTTLTATTHVVKYTFDAADNVPNAAYPGCIQSVSQNVVVNEAPSVSSIIPTAPLCPNGSDGKIDLTVSGGTVVKTFNWNKTGGGFFASTEDITGLTSGTYNVTITNTTSNTCSTTASAVVPNGIDKTNPVITCPLNQVLNLASRECRTKVVFADATATDNCSVTVARTDATGITSGDTLRYGTYNLAYKATDGSGNTAACNFSIKINEFVPSGGLACLGEVNMTASKTCFTRVTPAMILRSESGCIDNYRVEFMLSNGTVLVHPILDASFIGQRIKVSVVDPSGNTCWGYLNLEDKTAPEINCPSSAVISCADLGTTAAPTTAQTGAPTVVCECSPPTTLYYNDQNFDVACGVNLSVPPVGFPLGVAFDANAAVNARRLIVRTFTVKDKYNNASTCQQVIYVTRLKVFAVGCPAPATVVCQENTLRIAPTDTTINGVLVRGTGVPIFPNGSAITANSVCNAATSFSDIRTGNLINRTWAVATSCGDMRMCNQTITVNPSGATCGNNAANLRLSGIIQRENGDNVAAEVVLSNDNNPLNRQTAAAFSFSNLAPNLNYRLTPNHPNNDWNKGVTTLDAALISRHVLGITPLSTYGIIAGDVDRDGDVSGVDMLLIQQLVLRRRSEFPNNNSWRFVSKNYRFLNRDNPLAEPFDETFTMNNLTADYLTADFVAVKTGDVNQSAAMLQGGAAGQLEIRGARQPYVLSVEDVVLEKGKTYHIPIPIRKDPSVQALQFTLSVDKNMASIESIINGNTPNFNDNNVGFFKKEGIVTAAWYRKSDSSVVGNDPSVLFNLTLKPTETTRLSAILSLNAVYTEGVAYDSKGEGLPVSLSFSGQKTVATKASLLPNRPNPFNAETVLSFSLPEAEFAKLTVCDMMGKVVMTTEKLFAKGINDVVFSPTDPSVSSGIFVVRLQTAAGVAEQKIVLSR